MEVRDDRRWRRLPTATTFRWRTSRPRPRQERRNHVYFLGDRLVLRIPRRGGARLAELAKEATVIPAARQAGVRTPAIVTYDDSCSVVSVPYLVLERVPGA